MFNTFQNTLTNLLGQMFIPLISIASALSGLWAIYLGLKIWRSSGDENKRKEAKNAVISFVIGTIVIFVLAVGAPLLISALVIWFEENSLAFASPIVNAVVLNLRQVA